ncbi:hypothetical protein AA973_07245 [Helicobacter pylori]|uniref:Uncharacterized protein n=1 Tax=Helicobacter pylori TaxID=210 RepID=A0A1A9HCP1_HELPX|nr:hypothetical protein AA973_07245 [Helicobacter pylori]
MEKRLKFLKFFAKSVILFYSIMQTYGDTGDMLRYPNPLRTLLKSYCIIKNKIKLFYNQHPIRTKPFLFLQHQ